MDHVPARILWLLSRISDQRSSRIAQHLKLGEWPVYAALQQLERDGLVERVVVRRNLESVTVCRLTARSPNRARVIGNPERDYCFSRTTLNKGVLSATLIASSGGL